MGKRVTISSVHIEIPGQDSMLLPVDQARQLQEALNALFGIQSVNIPSCWTHTPPQNMPTVTYSNACVNAADSSFLEEENLP